MLFLYNSQEFISCIYSCIFFFHAYCFDIIRNIGHNNRCDQIISFFLNGIHIEFHKKLFIPVQGCLLEVVREQYADFYRDRERWRYLQKLDARNSLLSLDGFTDSEGNPLDFIADEAADIAETVVNAVMVDRLKAALPLLSDSEQELIQAIFFDGLSEREVGARLGITQSVVNKRKARILRKLRKIIEN